MRVLFDIVHPADVHMYRHIESMVRGAGGSTMVVSREKDVVTDLLDAFGMTHTVVGRSGARTRTGQAVELIARDSALVAAARRFRPTVILTRSPAGTHIGKFFGVPSVFDTDDGTAAKWNFRAAAPFATFVTTPASTEADFGANHFKYPGFKELAYLHPNRFVFDAQVRDELGVGKDPYFLVRFVGMNASHDRGESGFPEKAKRELVASLRDHGRVFGSVERGSAEAPGVEPLPVPAHRMHHVIAGASLVVGDSQTMAAESAVLGVPNFRCSTWVGRLDYLNELEGKWRLTRGFHPSESSTLLREVRVALARLPEIRASASSRRECMLSEKVDVTAWYWEFLTERWGEM